MSETTSEQLAEIEGQVEYTPREGWRVVQFGEPLRGGDEYDSGLNRYVRRIESQAQLEPETTTEQLVEIDGQAAEPEPQPQPVQVREGRWRTRNGMVRGVAAMPTDHEDFTTEFPWWDGKEETWTKHGHLLSSGECPGDLVEYLGAIEQEPQPEPQADQIEELRSEVSYVQRLLGESRQRVTQLEELVGSLRTINETQEKAVEAAGKENTALRNQLAAVKAELLTQAETSRRLQIELDAAQQVPADSPELQQLRLDLAEVTQDRDTYKDAHERVLSDLETIRETTKAETVETIAEWTEPFRRCGSERLAWMVMQNLPHIMRTLTGLTPED